MRMGDATMNAMHELTADELAQVEGGFLDPVDAGLIVGGLIVGAVILYGIYR
jgi:lactobin A/cerein 7B family class IIb bacteriocin